MRHPALEVAICALDTAANACTCAYRLLVKTAGEDTLDALVCGAKYCRDLSRDLDERH